jgi:hypothetical protein
MGMLNIGNARNAIGVGNDNVKQNPALWAGLGS